MVNIPNPNFRIKLEELLNKKRGEIITKKALAKIEKIDSVGGYCHDIVCSNRGNIVLLDLAMIVQDHRTSASMQTPFDF